MDVKKTKVESLDIIVTMMEDKPYYEIKYKEIGSDHFCIGYSSYRLDYVLEWKKQYFELVESEAGAGQGWIPCSERMPEDDGLYNTTLSGELIGADEAFTGQSYFENGHWEDDGDCVIAWMPLPKPYRGE